MLASAISELLPWAYSIPAATGAVRESFKELTVSEFVKVVRPLLKISEKPLPTAHLPVSLNAFVVE